MKKRFLLFVIVLLNGCTSYNITVKNEEITKIFKISYWNDIDKSDDKKYQIGTAIEYRKKEQEINFMEDITCITESKNFIIKKENIKKISQNFYFIPCPGENVTLTFSDMFFYFIPVRPVKKPSSYSIILKKIYVDNKYFYNQQISIDWSKYNLQQGY